LPAAYAATFVARNSWYSVSVIGSRRICIVHVPETYPRSNRPGRDGLVRPPPGPTHARPTSAEAPRGDHEPPERCPTYPCGPPPTSSSSQIADTFVSHRQIPRPFRISEAGAEYDCEDGERDLQSAAAGLFDPRAVGGSRITKRPAGSRRRC
jgi:hypothetical protein